jgi:3-phosphoshikimate 1-carboxyvinyltransferase
MQEGWPAPYASEPLDAVVVVPGSKSETNRALVIGAQVDTELRISGALDSRDTRLMVAALTALSGAPIFTPGAVPDELIAHGAGVWRGAGEPIDCGLAGTVMRFTPPLAALAPKPTRFFGDPAASHRPLAPMLDGLRQLGVQVEGDALPFAMIPGGHLGCEIAVDASSSSQYISGFLLAGSSYPNGLTIRHTGQILPSAPHIAMTVQMLRERGARIETGEHWWRVSPGALRGGELRIAPDLSNAAAFLVAGVLSRGRVRVPNWPTLTDQPGEQIRDILRRFGAETSLEDDVLTARWTGGLQGGDLELGEASELTPVVAALAVFAEGPTTIRGVGHIRGHETDRLAAIATNLGAVGVRCAETEDGLVIDGVGEDTRKLRGARLNSYADHRMAQLNALLGLRIPGVVVDDVATTAKTMPDFTARWASLFGGPR